MLSRYVAPASRLHIVRYQFDQRILARITLAAILWLQGFPDQARNTAEGTIEDALAIDHPISLTYALAQSACPITLETGDLDAAERFLKLINDQASRFPSAAWDLWSRCLRGKLLIKRGDFTVAARVLAAARDRLAAVYGRFSEGFGTSDLRKAKQLLDELG